LGCVTARCNASIGIERRHLDGEAEIGLGLVGDLVDGRHARTELARTMFLLFCAQITGKPVTAPLPIAAPARPAAPLSILRRPTPPSIFRPI